MIFREMILTNYEGTVELKKQLLLNDYSCILPVRLGDIWIEITAIQGKIRLNHSSFNCDGGTFSCPPAKRQTPHYNIEQGNSVNIKVNIGEQFGRIDQISIVNPQMLKPAVFKYKLTFSEVSAED